MRPHFCESPFYREKVASLTESPPFEFGRPHFRTLSTFPTFSAEMSVQIRFEIGFQHFNFEELFQFFVMKIECFKIRCCPEARGRHSRLFVRSVTTFHFSLSIKILHFFELILH